MSLTLAILLDFEKMKISSLLSASVFLTYLTVPSYASSCSEATVHFNRLTDEFASVYNSMEFTPEYLCSYKFQVAHEKLVKLTRERIPYAKVLESCPADKRGSSVAQLEQFISEGKEKINSLSTICTELSQEARTKKADEETDPRDDNQCLAAKEIPHKKYQMYAIRLTNRCKKTIRILYSSCDPFNSKLDKGEPKCTWNQGEYVDSLSTRVIRSWVRYPEWKLK